ncbi:MAG: response regulator [SAR324 cluster bacterium]
MPNRRRGPILLVDDEKSVLDVTRMILEHFGFLVIAADGGVEALNRFGRHRAEIQIVILDLTMPDMEGAEVFRRIREVRPGIPILLSSGYTAASVPPELARQPGTGFLQKPYRAAALIGKIEELIGSTGPA